MTFRTQFKVQGWIEVICGSMFSGKTEELLRRMKRAQIAKQKIQVFKPSIDNRYSLNHVESHNANKISSQNVNEAIEILDLVEDNTRVVGIDEAQFFDEGIVDTAQKLAYRGIHVVVAGLDMDYLGQPFGSMPKLMAIAEDVLKLSAVCVICGNPASRTQRVAHSAQIPGSTSKILIGAHDLYEARCRFCHEPNFERLNPTPSNLPTQISPQLSEQKPLVAQS